VPKGSLRHTIAASRRNIFILVMVRHTRSRARALQPRLSPSHRRHRRRLDRKRKKPRVRSNRSWGQFRIRSMTDTAERNRRGKFSPHHRRQGRASLYARRHVREAASAHAAMGDVLHHGTGARAPRKRHTASPRSLGTHAAREYHATGLGAGLRSLLLDTTTTTVR
jgi:hypothetical protein